MNHAAAPSAADGPSGAPSSTHAAVRAAPASVPSGPEHDPDWASAARASLAVTDARLARRFDQGEIVDRLVALRARAVDALILDAWSRCVAPDARLALFAVGGYGRGELFPQSDIDLMVLAEPDDQQAQHDGLARFFALLWDAGLEASQAVRSPVSISSFTPRPGRQE